jgi:hypothetical protein
MASSSSSEPETRIKGVLGHLVRPFRLRTIHQTWVGEIRQDQVYAAAFECRNKIITSLDEERQADREE